MYDIIIIGAGPAGLTAAIYGLRAGKKVLVLEEKAIGGQIVNAKKIKNYPGIIEISGQEFSHNMVEQVKLLGGEIKLEKVTRLNIDKQEKSVETDMNEKYSAKKIIIATGTENRRLGLPREKEMTGKGISYCATCDGHFYQGKKVAVIGGGNTALMDAIYLSELAEKVYLIHRRNEFRAEKAYVDEVKEKKNVVFVLNSNVIASEGEKVIEKVIVKNNKTGAEQDLAVDGVFVAVGYQPQNQIFKDVIALDEAGYIKTDDGTHTSVDGVYVAGDARAKELKQLTTAVSDGAIAATLAIKEM